MRPYSRPRRAIWRSVLAACRFSAWRGQRPEEKLTDAEREIARLAIDALAAVLQVPKDRIRVDAIQPVEWPDSSVGCPQPGMAYMQVITAGHRISLRADGNIHVVNEANGRAFVCRQNDARGEYDATPACGPRGSSRFERWSATEGQLGGPTPPAEEGAPRPLGSIAGSILRRTRSSAAARTRHEPVSSAARRASTRNNSLPPGPCASERMTEKSFSRASRELNSRRFSPLHHRQTLRRQNNKRGRPDSPACPQRVLHRIRGSTAPRTARFSP